MAIAGKGRPADSAGPAVVHGGIVRSLSVREVYCNTTHTHTRRQMLRLAAGMPEAHLQPVQVTKRILWCVVNLYNYNYLTNNLSTRTSVHVYVHEYHGKLIIAIAYCNIAIYRYTASLKYP